MIAASVEERDGPVAPRRRARRLTSAQIEELVATVVTGSSTRELAGRYSIHRTTVAQHLKATGIAIRTHARKLSDQDLPAIVARYAAGDSTATNAAD